MLLSCSSLPFCYVIVVLPFALLIEAKSTRIHVHTCIALYQCSLCVTTAVVRGVHVASTAPTRGFREEITHKWRCSEQRRRDGACVLWQVWHSKQKKRQMHLPPSLPSPSSLVPLPFPPPSLPLLPLFFLLHPFSPSPHIFGLPSNYPRGAFVMEYCGEVISPVQFEERKKQYTNEKRRHYYFMSLRSDEVHLSVVVLLCVHGEQLCLINVHVCIMCTYTYGSYE